MAAAIVISIVTLLVVITIAGAIAEAGKRADREEGTRYERQVKAGRQTAEDRHRLYVKRAAGRAAARRNLPRL
jgi:hypothetical protein